MSAALPKYNDAAFYAYAAFKGPFPDRLADSPPFSPREVEILRRLKAPLTPPKGERAKHGRLLP